jgi:hypothetical protein
MKWKNITTEADLPKVDGDYVVELNNGSYSKLHFNPYVKGFFMKNVKRWLDESEPEAVFTVEQGLKIWQEGYSSGHTDGFNDVWEADLDIKEYFKLLSNKLHLIR